MDKTITSVGGALIGLGVGLLTAISIDPSMHSAFYTGGYLWIIVGTGTAIFGARTKKEKLIEKKSYKSNAI